MKRHRQNQKRRERNKHVKSSVRTKIKKVIEAIEAKEPDKAAAAFIEAQSHISDAGRKRVMHPRTSSRKISRLARKINSMLDRKSA